MPLSSWGAGLAEGISGGLRNAAVFQNIKSGQAQEERALGAEKRAEAEGGLRMFALNRQKELAIKEDAANADIAKLTTDHQASIQDLTAKITGLGDVTPPAEFKPSSGGGQDNSGWENAAGKAVYNTSLKAYEAKAKAKAELQQQLAGVTGDITTQEYNTYLKYGLTDKANSTKKHHIDVVKEIAVAIGPEAALATLKTGPMGALFPDAKVKDKGDHFEIKNYGGGDTNKDGIVTMDKRNGAITNVQSPTPKEDFKATPYDSYRKGMLAKGMSEEKIATGWETNQSNLRKGEKDADKQYAPAELQKKVEYLKGMFPNAVNSELIQMANGEHLPTEKLFMVRAAEKAQTNGEDPTQAATRAQLVYRTIMQGKEAPAIDPAKRKPLSTFGR
jgi:hypothetical protein